MSAIAIVLLFGAAFAASVWTLYVSVRPQLHRFAELTRPAAALPGLPPRLSRITARAVPARMPALASAFSCRDRSRCAASPFRTDGRSVSSANAM